MTPYFEQAGIRIFCGDARDVLPRLDLSEVGLVLADPPYGETSLAWDRWPVAWPATVAACVPGDAAMWCHGSLRMFFDHLVDFAGWKLAQEVVWEKQNGTGFATDRFRRVHELVVMWYRGPWSGVYSVPPKVGGGKAKTVRRRERTPHWGAIADSTYVSEDGGPRLMRSVIRVPNEHGKAGVANETQKPLGLVEPLVRSSLRPGRALLDPFCGSGTVLVAAKAMGARAVGIDLREEQCEAAARRLTQTLAFGVG